MLSALSSARLFQFLILGLILFITQPSLADVHGNALSGTSDVSPAAIENLLQELEDPQKLESLKQNLRVLLAAQEKEFETLDEPPSLVGYFLSMMTGYIETINLILVEAGQTILQTPAMVQDIFEQAREPEVLVTWGEMAAKIILVLLAGLLAQWLTQRFLARTRKALEDQEAYNKGLRLLLLTGNTILELIPVAAFAVAAYGLLPLLDPRPVTQVVALTLINANVLVRFILALSRLILIPGSSSLRMLPMSNESVHYLYIWIRRVVRISVYGFFILEAGLALGLADSLYTFLLKLLGFVITLMAIILILQNRAEIASWLKETPDDPDTEQQPPAAASGFTGIQALTSLRRRLGDFWHIAAILLIITMFGTWFLEVPGGLLFLARSIVMTAVVIAVFAILIRLSHKGLVHLFKISDELKEKHPDLEARANRYLPLLKNGVKGILYVIAAFSILQVWGAGTFSWLFSPQGWAIVSEILVIALIIAGTLLIWEVVSIKIEGFMARERQEPTASSRLLTLLPLLNNVIRIALILVAGMSVLAHLGINIAPLLAGAGVIGLAIGFGAQTLVRDVITGAFILIENSIAVGDFVEAGGHSGTVESLTVRSVTLRDLTGTVHVVPFGDVTSVKNYNRDYGYALIDAGVAYREDYGEVVHLLQEVAEELKQDENWGPNIIGDLEVFGMNNLGDSAVEIRVRLKTKPLTQFSVRRAFLERMKRKFDEHNIEIPFPHQTIWFGEDKKGSAPPMRMIKQTPESIEPREVTEVESQEIEKTEVQYFSESDASRDVVQEKEALDEVKEQQEKQSG